MPELHVNVDHVATIRQARQTVEPSPLQAVMLLEDTGIHGITLHLREDRRHIQDNDIYEIDRYLKDSKLSFTFEMAASSEMRDILLKTSARTATIVPENRAEITTEGGMDLTKDVEYFKEFIKPIQNAGFIASYFIDPDLEQVTAAYECESKSIELHTGKYANLFLEDENLEYYAKNRKLHISVLSEVERLKQAAEKAINLGIKVNLGHGLTPNNLSQMLKIPQVSELHIGHSIIANSIFLGIKDSVGEFLKQINA